MINKIQSIINCSICKLMYRIRWVSVDNNVGSIQIMHHACSVPLSKWTLYCCIHILCAAWLYQVVYIQASNQLLSLLQKLTLNLYWVCFASVSGYCFCSLDSFYRLIHVANSLYCDRPQVPTCIFQTYVNINTFSKKAPFIVPVIERKV